MSRVPELGRFCLLGSATLTRLKCHCRKPPSGGFLHDRVKSLERVAVVDKSLHCDRRKQGAAGHKYSRIVKFDAALPETTMKESTFNLFARAHADQVIYSFLDENPHKAAPEDDPRFQSYFNDVSDLDSALPISPSAIFYDACEDKCNDLLIGAGNILDDYRVSDCDNLKMRLKTVSTRLDKMGSYGDVGYAISFAPWVNCVLEANRLHQAAQCVAAAEIILQDSAIFFPEVPGYLLP